jgi:integrase
MRWPCYVKIADKPRLNDKLSDRFRVHDLRHTAASLLVQAGYPPKMLQEIMGHASITTTLDLYGICIPARWTSTRTA